ncbi:hypothetical protein WA026_007343 [Henosepilachna vigintioctopunctata]|uniref:Acyltransferase n=1 Tax=Henosepilachna vigintioctopunctata TaxID=420089 RepID=A0AAW1ULX7_9CUCU
MAKLRVEFAPLTLPIRRRVQTLTAAAWFVTMAYGGMISIILTLYLVFGTKYWWITISYMIWIFLDRYTSETGGRRNNWVQSMELWQYFKNYFPIRLHRLPWIQLSPKKNYLFCCFPHGMLPTGTFSVFSTKQGEFSDYFPGLKPYGCAMAQHFHIPFFREIVLSLGGCSPSENSLNYLLSKEEGGNAVALLVGGSTEAYYCKPRQYKLVLKNRKGFVRIALTNGSPLVPVFSFGETDLFNQINKGDESFVRKCQEILKKLFGISPIIPLGRGLLQYSFGLVPHRRPVNVVVGQPIPVEKTENPTQTQIDDLHKMFVDSLINLFETQKHNYIKDADDIHIELL